MVNVHRLQDDCVRAGLKLTGEGRKFAISVNVEGASFDLLFGIQQSTKGVDGRFAEFLRVLNGFPCRSLQLRIIEVRSGTRCRLPELVGHFVETLIPRSVLLRRSD